MHKVFSFRICPFSTFLIIRNINVRWWHQTLRCLIAVPPGDSHIMCKIADAGDGGVPRPRRCQFPIFVRDAIAGACNLKCRYAIDAGFMIIGALVATADACPS